MVELGAAGIDLDLGAPALDLDEPDTFIEAARTTVLTSPWL